MWLPHSPEYEFFEDQTKAWRNSQRKDVTLDKLIFRPDIRLFLSLIILIRCSYLSFSWEIGHPLSMYVTRGMDEDHPKCLQMRTGGEGHHTSCVRTHLHYLFSCFCLMVSSFICRNLTLSSFKKCVSEMVILSNEINFCCNKISFFFSFKLFSEPKLAKTVLILIK